MKKVLLASASALAIVTGSAFAADVIPEPVPAPTWTGLHIGIGGGAGYNFYDADSEATLFIDDGGGLEEVLSNSVAGDDLGAWYGFGTVEIGFDFQFEDSPFVIGILANYDFNGSNDANAESDTSVTDGVTTISLNNNIEAELDDAWFLGGRLGFAFQEDTLIYALGGYTWVEGKVKSDHQVDVNGAELIGFHVDEDDDVDGWTIGAGIEHMFTESLSLKIEYRHDFLNDVDFEEETVFDDGDIVVVQEGSVDFSRDTVRAVLSWRFNAFGW